MTEEIIKEYITTTLSIETLALRYKVGKLKIKEILLNNNVPTRKKGGQIKHHEIDFNVDIKNKTLKCNKCSLILNDVENKSGSVTQHITQCSPDIEIPNKLFRANYKKTNGSYWHFQFFTLINKPEIKVLTCPECEWTTPDIDNKTGSLTKHVEKCHGTVSEFIERNTNYLKYFNKLVKDNDRQELLSDNENFVICKICDEKLRVITNTHMEKHSLTVEDYKIKFPHEKIVSDNTLITFTENLSSNAPSIFYRSKDEIEINDFLISENIITHPCNRSLLHGTELDIYLPEHSVAIEYNGLFWHGEKQGKTKHYHLDKTKKCLDKNVRLIHIFEDEWNEKKDIIKNRLLNIIGKNKSERIYARKCKVIEISKEEKNDFLTNNHLQGNDNSSIHLGLFYKSELVSVMTFGKPRIFMGNKTNDDNTYELYRFTTKNVIGSFSKLLKYFIKQYNPHKIITYADRNWSPSNDFCFYGKMGFKYVSETKPNYYYTKRNKKREHRFNYRKDKLVKMGYDKNKSEFEIMNELGYDKIWDTGNLKYEMIL